MHIVPYLVHYKLQLIVSLYSNLCKNVIVGLVVLLEVLENYYTYCEL